MMQLGGIVGRVILDPSGIYDELKARGWVDGDQVHLPNEIESVCEDLSVDDIEGILLAFSAMAAGKESKGQCGK